MILNRNEKSGNVQATLKNDEGEKEIYDCFFSACDNPTCLCSTLEIELMPLSSTSDEKDEPARLVIDLQKRNVGKSEKRPLTPDETIWSGAFIKLLDEEDFEILITEFKKYKNTVSETSDTRAIDMTFDFDDIENNRAMMAYNDILPYGDLITIEMEGSIWAVLDQHCLKTNCNCSDLYLEFNRYNASNSFDDVFFVLGLDYKKRRWSEYESMAHRPWSVQQIRDALEDAYPDFYEMLSSRNDKLKALYGQSKNKYYKAKSVSTQKKVGRNELCPCGSGKKYKNVACRNSSASRK